ncbi:MAG: hypothetical protein ACR2QA_06420 [Solirubrobacteraceae bacterium]
MEASRFSRRTMPQGRAGRPVSTRPVHPGFIRWLWIWITVGALVVVVVIGFLLAIVHNLNSIDSGLGEANASVTGIGAEAHPLPTYIQEINSNLTSIDGALKPISGQADQIVSGLTSVQGKLGQINGSLVSTSGSLVNTSGSLVDTSNSLVSTNGTLGTIESSLSNTSGTLVTISSSLAGPVNGTLSTVSGQLVDVANRLHPVSGSLVDISRRLVDVRNRAGSINTVLNNAEFVRTNGTQAIWRHVRFANGGSFSRPGFDASLSGPGANPNGLQPVKGDADTIIGGLGQVNGHLLSICQSNTLNSALLQTLGLVKIGPCGA